MQQARCRSTGTAARIESGQVPLHQALLAFYRPFADDGELHRILHWILQWPGAAYRTSLANERWSSL